MSESPQSSEARIPCPVCGTKYKWKPELAGRKLRCRCGVIMRMPKEPRGAAKFESAAPSPSGIHATTKPSPPQPAVAPPPAGDEGYDLELSELAQVTPSAAVPPKPIGAGSSGLCPSCGQPVNPKAVICLDCGFNLAEGRKLETTVGDDEAAATAGGRSPAALKQKHSTASRVEEQAGIAPKRKIRGVYLSLALLGVGLLIVVAYFILYKKR